MHNHNNSINSDGQNAYSQRPEKPWYSTDPVPSNIELPADPRRYKLIPIDFTMTGNIKIVVYVALGDFCHHIFFFSFFCLIAQVLQVKRHCHTNNFNHHHHHQACTRGLAKSHPFKFIEGAG